MAHMTMRAGNKTPRVCGPLIWLPSITVLPSVAGTLAGNPSHDCRGTTVSYVLQDSDYVLKSYRLNLTRQEIQKCYSVVCW